MTTVAYRNGIIAVDSRAQAGGWNVCDTMTKMIRLNDGTIVTGTGDWELVARFMRAMETKEASTPDLKDAARGIIAFSTGEIVIYEGVGWFPLHDVPFMAWGSGMPPALAALHMGASAERAVEIAAMIDPSTGGAIVSMKVGVQLAEAAE